MKYVIVSVQDVLTGFLGVSPAQSEKIAMRDFARAVKDKSSLLFSNPQDYRLYKVGEFDSESGKLDPCEPTVICSGYDFVKEED